MYTHIALFKWKPSAEKSAIEAALKDVEALQGKIPGVIEISTGENQSRYAEGYTHVVLVRGENKEAIEAYRKHSDHELVSAKIESMEEHGIGVDFET